MCGVPWYPSVREAFSTGLHHEGVHSHHTSQDCCGVISNFPWGAYPREPQGIPPMVVLRWAGRTHTHRHTFIHPWDVHVLPSSDNGGLNLHMGSTPYPLLVNMSEGLFCEDYLKGTHFIHKSLPKVHVFHGKTLFMNHEPDILHCCCRSNKNVMLGTHNMDVTHTIQNTLLTTHNFTLPCKEILVWQFHKALFWGVNYESYIYNWQLHTSIV